jgi:hypothetical protein
MLNQRLQQKLLQKLSPQQIQMIKLLEVPTLQIEDLKKTKLRRMQKRISLRRKIKTRRSSP